MPGQTAPPHASELPHDALKTASPSNSETYNIEPFPQAKLVDREGNIWFGDGKGIHRFSYSRLTKLELPKNADTRFVLTGKNILITGQQRDRAQCLHLNHVAGTKREVCGLEQELRARRHLRNVLEPTATDTSVAYDATVQAGGTYYYVVNSVDASGNESAYSNQAQAVIPTP